MYWVSSEIDDSVQGIDSFVLDHNEYLEDDVNTASGLLDEGYSIVQGTVLAEEVVVHFVPYALALEEGVEEEAAEAFPFLG